MSSNDTPPEPEDREPPSEAPAREEDAASTPDPRDRMPKWVPRAIVLFFVAYAAFNVAGWLFIRLSELIVILLVALFLSFALEPAVNRFAQRGIRRGLATAIVLFGFALFLMVLVGTIGAVVVNQTSDFAKDSDKYLANTERFVRDHIDKKFSIDQFKRDLNKKGGIIDRGRGGITSGALSVGLTVLAGIFEVLTILLFTFYLVADGPRLRKAICSLLRPDRQKFVLNTWEIAIDKTGGYLYSRLLLAFLSFVAHWIAFEIIGVPYAAALAVFVGIVSQFIPVVGTYIAAFVPSLVALLNNPVSAVWVLAFAVVYQQIENYLFAPRVTARTMAMHPAVAFGAVIAGGALLGATGALLALPAAAVAQAFVSGYVQRHDVTVESHLLHDPRDAQA
ncbi:MAG: AI-2E family transporter [Acidimicrobiia bacterium]